MDLGSLSWPLSRLGEGIEELIRRAGMGGAPHAPLTIPASVTRAGVTELARWIAWAADHLGLEAKPVETTVRDLDQLLGRAGPAVLQINDGQGKRFLLLLESRMGRPQLLRPDLGVGSCAIDDLHQALCAQHEIPLRPQIDRLLDLAHVPQRCAKRVGEAIARERLASKRIAGFWIFRPSPATSFWRQLTRARIPHKLAAMLGLFAIVYGLEIVGWTVVGAAALDGRLDLGWLGAWALLLMSMVPIRLTARWFDSTLAIEVGRVLKTRLLAGALRLDLEAVRHQGFGQLLGRVLDSQALEALALNGGLSAIVAIVELGLAAWVMSLGPAGALHLVLLLLWLAIAFGWALRYFRSLRDWTAMRLEMTHDLVERMVGHRTTQAQEWPARRDQREDQRLKDYLHSSEDMDRKFVPFVAGVSSGWTFVGLAGFAPAFVAGTVTPAALAIGLGGVFLANRAFTGIASGLAAAARAGIAWRQVAPLFKAAARPVSTLPFVSAPQMQPQMQPQFARAAPSRLIEAEGLVYCYPAQGEPVLDRASLTIHHGERLLVEGGSGGGKSTLASLLVGLRRPDSGLLLLNGLDRNTLGDAWHEFATEAPQFHENHILTGTLAFNLLMGRNWPASDKEIKEAHDLCVELGLGDLIERMPSGVMQTIGETGWQLSHGERSRIFLARALLQDAQLTVLDESFAALDPETLQKCLNCALRRARTLVVIAHP